MTISAISSLTPVYQAPQAQAPKAIAQNATPVAPAGGGDSDGDNDGSGGVNLLA